MRDTFPKQLSNKRSKVSSSPWDIECGILNLDVSKNNGTHWVCYYKNNEKCYYFYSLGLDPPLELQVYLSNNIELLTFQIQKFNTHCYILSIF